MGKGSKLRQGAEEKEYISNGNGRRKEWDTGREFFDPDAPPPGVNTDIWNLALYYRDKVLPGGEDLSGKVPIVYTILQKALTNLGPSDILARARTTGIQVTNGTKTWVTIVEKAIDEYYSGEFTTDINNFGGTFKFEYYVQRSLDTTARELLVSTGKLVPQPDREPKPSRRTKEQQENYEIRKRQYTEEELQEKMRDFRSRN